MQDFVATKPGPDARSLAQTAMISNVEKLSGIETNLGAEGQEPPTTGLTVKSSVKQLVYLNWQSSTQAREIPDKRCQIQ